MRTGRDSGGRAPAPAPAVGGAAGDADAPAGTIWATAAGSPSCHRGGWGLAGGRQHAGEGGGEFREAGVVSVRGTLPRLPLAVVCVEA